MNGRQNKGTGRILLLAPEDIPQKPEPVQELCGRLRMAPNRCQNIDLTVPDSRPAQVLAVAHVFDNSGDRLVPLVFLHVLEMRAGRLHISDDHGLQLRIPKRHLQDRELHPPAQVADQLRLLLVQIHAQLIVHRPESIDIVWIISQLNNVGDIHHRAVRKEPHFRIPDPVRNPFPLQKIHQRNRALIIPVKHRRLLRAAVRHLQKILVLRLPTSEVYFSDARLRALSVRSARSRPALGCWCRRTCGADASRLPA